MKTLTKKFSNRILITANKQSRTAGFPIILFLSILFTTSMTKADNNVFANSGIHYSGNDNFPENVSITPDTSVCKGDSLMLEVILPGAGPFTLVVGDGTGTDTISGVPSSPFTIFVSPENTTIYTLISYADASSVFQTVNLSCTVTVIPAPVITLPNYPAICYFGAIMLVGATPDYGIWSGNNVFDWGGIGIGSLYPHAGANPIQYTFTDIVTGCIATATDTIYVVEHPEFDLTPSQAVCPYDTTILEVTNLPAGSYEYLWSTGDTTSSVFVNPSVSTTYTVTVTETASGLGCNNHEKTILLVATKPIINIGDTLNVCANGTININTSIGFQDYIWSTGDSTYLITLDGASIGLNNTMPFSVTVTNHYGCQGSDTVWVTAIDCTGLDELSSESKITFWPNPNDGNFFIRIKGITGDATLRISNVTGQTISVENLTLDGEWVKEFNLGNMAPGIYFVRLNTKTDVVTKQIIIK